MAMLSGRVEGCSVVGGGVWRWQYYWGELVGSILLESVWRVAVLLGSVWRVAVLLGVKYGGDPLNLEIEAHDCSTCGLGWWILIEVGGWTEMFYCLAYLYCV